MGMTPNTAPAIPADSPSSSVGCWAADKDGSSGTEAGLSALGGDRNDEPVQRQLVSLVSGQYLQARGRSPA